jgi:hypothetical protein
MTIPGSHTSTLLWTGNPGDGSVEAQPVKKRESNKPVVAPVTSLDGQVQK